MPEFTTGKLGESTIGAKNRVAREPFDFVNDKFHVSICNSVVGGVGSDLGPGCHWPQH